MKISEFNPEDPRLTAYALGEMEPAARVEFEQWLRSQPEAQRAVEEIRAATALLGEALAEEPGPETAQPIEAAAIIAGRDPRQLDGGPAKKPALAKVLRFPALYFLTSGLAAACFALFFVNWNRQFEAKEMQMKASARAESARRSTFEVAAMEKRRAQAREPAAVELPAAEAVAASEVAPVPAVLAMRATGRGAAKPEQFVVTGGSIPGIRAGADGGADASSLSSAAPAMVAKARESLTTESYAHMEENPFLDVRGNPLSTFSADVDTASYANVRRLLAGKQRPPKGAVRIEELVNYFPYRYAPPADRAPFAAHLEVAGAPWAPTHRLVRIGLKGREVSDAARPRANLVFLLDVSGSMNEPAKLPLVQQAMKLLLGRLRADDRVAIAVYAGASGLALPSTPVREKAKIAAAIDALEAEGSTNGAAGIRLAYDIAKANFIPGGVNRVVLATDGDFNVGVADESELTALIQEKAESGVFLSVLGFGMGNYKDSTLEKLADKGNGNYAYIDSLAEAKKALVEQAGGTLVTIAKDVKLQVEFNPAEVRAYRLIGYENRLLRKEDFNNDQVDAGEIGAGHTVTALYEVVPAGAAMPDAGTVDALKYQRTDSAPRRVESEARGELLTLKIRYKEPDGGVSTKLEFPLRDSGRAFADASADFKFAAAVASFGMILRESPHRGGATLAQVAEWAREGTADDAGGYRAEFSGLVAEAAAVMEE